MTWCLDVSVRLDNERFGTFDLWTYVNDLLQKTVPKECDSAGTGFGCRDMQWTFGSKAVAEYYSRKLQETFAGCVECISVYEETTMLS